MLYLAPDDTKRDAPKVDWQARYQELAESSKNEALQRYYRAGVPAADTPISEVPLVAVDFETTGLDPSQHGIVSIALVPMQLSAIEINGAKQWVVKPQRTLTDESVTIHGITHSEIDNAPDIETIIGPLLESVAGKVWVVHYHGIERPFLQDAFKRRIEESIEFPVIDTMEIEARFRRQKPSLWDKLTGKKPASIRLADSRQRYGLPFYAPHDAMTDALACGELLQAQVAHHFSADTPLSEIWLP